MPQVGVMVADPIIAVPMGGGATVRVGLQTKVVEAPVAMGTPVVGLSSYYQEVLLKQVPLLAAVEVDRGSWLKIMWDNATRRFRDLIRKPR